MQRNVLLVIQQIYATKFTTEHRNQYELKKKAKSQVKRDNAGWENVESKDNIYWGSYMADYMVIISTSTTNLDGCKRFTYGVGFGTNSSSALKNAKYHLGGRNWRWSENKHGYRIVREKRF